MDKTPWARFVSIGRIAKVCCFEHAANHRQCKSVKNDRAEAGRRDCMNKFNIRSEIWITADMFYSEAFRKLSAAGKTIFLRCLQKRKWEYKKVNGRKRRVYPNDPFIFPYAEAAFLGVGTTTFWKVMQHLIAVGFLDLVHQGGWYQKHQKEKDYSLYQLSERWRQHGTPEFKAVAKPKVLQEQFYIRQNIERQELKATSQTRRGQLHKTEVDRPKLGNNRLHKTEAGQRAIKSREAFANVL